MKYLLLLFLFPLMLLGQDQAKLDSLNGLFEDAKHDTIKAKVLFMIGDEYKKSDIKLAENNFRHALSYAIKGSEILLEAKAYYKIGLIYKNSSRYQQSIEYYIKSLNIKDSLGLKSEVASELLNIGDIYYDLGNQSQALGFFSKSLNIYENLGDSSGIAASLNSLGMISSDQGSYDQALEYYTKSLKIDENLGDTSGIAGSLNNIGTNYYYQGKLKLALEYFSKSLKVEEGIDNKPGIASSLNNIGIIYHDQSKYEIALSYLEKGYAIDKALNDKWGQAGSLASIGEVYYELKLFNKAISIGEKGLAFAQDINDVYFIQDNSLLLYKAYNKTGQSNKALLMYKLHIDMRDSIKNEETKNKIMRYEFDKKIMIKNKELEFNDQKHKNQLDRQELKTRYGYGIGILLFIIMSSISLLLYHNDKLKSKSNKALKSINNILDIKNNKIIDSINYAKKIQNAFLPTDQLLKKHFNDVFIYFKPKDIVSGDFYWFSEQKDKLILATADCTGHGVPGSMVSMTGNSLLNEIVNAKKIYSPSKILSQLNSSIIYTFQKDDANSITDGMDIAIICVDKKTDILTFSGAVNPLYVVYDNKLIELKGNPQSIGGGGLSRPDRDLGNVHFDDYELELKKGMTLYMFTDGFIDQFGGKNNIKFNIKPFKKLLIKINNQPLNQQKEIITQCMNEWMEESKAVQLDDMCIMGIKI